MSEVDRKCRTLDSPAFGAKKSSANYFVIAKVGYHVQLKFG